MRVLFMGTPQFAAYSLEALCQAGMEVVGVVTQPDRPKGRGHKLQPPPVKELALAQNLSVYQPETLKNGSFMETVKELAPEVIVVAAYGKILPQEMLQYPKYGCINVHASLLPKYRGAAPIQRCIMEGETQTGVTIMQMDAGLDTGDMLLQEAIEIGPEETADELTVRLAQLGGRLLVEALGQAEQGTLRPMKQDDSQSSYAHRIERTTGLLDFTRPGQALCNLVRAVSAYTYLEGKKLKVLKACFLAGELKGEPGEVLNAGTDGLDVAVSDGIFRILTLQAEGKKAMAAADYLRGHRIAPGVVLGE